MCLDLGNQNLGRILDNLSAASVTIVILLPIVDMTVLFGIDGVTIRTTSRLFSRGLPPRRWFSHREKDNHDSVFCQPHFMALHVAHYRGGFVS